VLQYVSEFSRLLLDLRRPTACFDTINIRYKFDRVWNYSNSMIRRLYVLNTQLFSSIFILIIINICV